LKSDPSLESALRSASDRGLIIPRSENNVYLRISYKGAGGAISEKWNVKIYFSGSVVCNDEKVLDDIIQNKVGVIDKSKSVLQIDDSGWGMPVCGVMVGVTDGKSVLTDVVNVSFFQSPSFEKKTYLAEYAKKGWKLVTEGFKATPKTHRVEICTGYVNTELKKLLRSGGYDVTVVEIKGLLQDTLEDLFKEYVRKTLGVDLAYDPKELKSSGGGNKAVAENYYRVLEWGQMNAPHLLKSGWKSMN
jgi:hypothetical protein